VLFWEWVSWHMVFAGFNHYQGVFSSDTIRHVGGTLEDNAGSRRGIRQPKVQLHRETTRDLQHHQTTQTNLTNNSSIHRSCESKNTGFPSAKIQHKPLPETPAAHPAGRAANHVLGVHYSSRRAPGWSTKILCYSGADLRAQRRLCMDGACKPW
jgi:hypothetical protein